jgi:thioredoxin 1
MVLAVAFAMTAGNAANKKVIKKPVQPAVKQLPKLLDLGATKCIPCKMMAPILEELAKEYKGRLEIEFIDVWKDQKAAEKYKIQSIPTQIFYDAKGKEFFRHVGFFPKEDILKTFEKQGIKLKKPDKK